MIFVVFRVNQDIIYIGSREIIKVLAEYSVNIPLESGRSISQTE